jgi:4-hydroxysphinganine ceramide fatty acyl 2-hydroxylase
MKNYISNRNETVRMFDNQFMEFFTHVHPATPLVIFLPVVIYFSYTGFTVFSIPVFYYLTTFIFGLFIWSFTEYVLHRFAFHIKADTNIKKYIYFMIHGVHHDYPNDGTRLVMVPAVSIPLATVFYYAFRYLLGVAYINAFFPGFITGYLIYDMMHYAIHHFKMRGKVLTAIKKHHFKHHYETSKKYFGVSTPLWDYFFGTK